MVLEERVMRCVPVMEAASAITRLEEPENWVGGLGGGGAVECRFDIWRYCSW